MFYAVVVTLFGTARVYDLNPFILVAHVILAGGFSLSLLMVLSPGARARVLQSPWFYAVVAALFVAGGIYGFNPFFLVAQVVMVGGLFLAPFALMLFLIALIGR